MGTKINIQTLAKSLAKKKGMPQKDAEAFLRTFFDAVVSGVTADKVVKVKGLGTFKLIEVLDRESVNVSTGERIVIAGHTKLSFTPDAALRDIINKPFADFQTVVINEGTSLADMERVPAEEAETVFPDEEEPVREQAAEPSVGTGMHVPEPPTPAAEADTAADERAEDLPAAQEPEPAREPSMPAEPQPEPEPASAAPAAPKPSSVPKIMGMVAGVLLLCVASYFAGYYRQADTPAEEQPTSQTPAPVTLPAEQDTDSTVVAEKPAEEPAPAAEAQQYAQVPGGKYRITGTRRTYEMKPGDYLTRIALREYGDQELARYIIVHNNFPDPDNVPIGAVIKLPEVEEVQ